MGKINLLDCTLRDGGYINNWHFGEKAIKGIISRLTRTGIEMLEIGFIKGETYNSDYSIFPDTNCFENVITPKSDSVIYVGMLDIGNPVPKEKIYMCNPNSIDGIRVIFKKNNIEKAYEYCKHIKKMGYKFFVNFVSSDQYSDKEFIDALEIFDKLKPDGVTIVDTFGLLKRKQFMRLISLADNNIHKDCMLCYHAHNNLQQAFGNAEIMVEMNLRRDICIDACIFGMGRGAGNLNLELFAEYMNENYDTYYNIAPMLEIMDIYLNDIYKTKFWGYSLPLYLSAKLECHPNYAIYFAEKNSLPVKSFNELLKKISPEDKLIFKKEIAEKYYLQYLENYIDDSKALESLANEFSGKNILVLAPGKNLLAEKEKVDKVICRSNTITIAVNFDGGIFNANYVFSSNMKRYAQFQSETKAQQIITSNIKEYNKSAYVMNFSSYASQYNEISDNSGIMLLRILVATGIKQVSLAGMDGYSPYNSNNYFNSQLEYDFSQRTEQRNKFISLELQKISKFLDINFVTSTNYEIVNFGGYNENSQYSDS